MVSKAWSSALLMDHGGSYARCMNACCKIGKDFTEGDFGLWREVYGMDMSDLMVLFAIVLSAPLDTSKRSPRGLFSSGVCNTLEIPF